MQLPASLDAVDDAEKRRGEAGRHEDVEKSHHREASSFLFTVMHMSLSR